MKEALEKILSANYLGNKVVLKELIETDHEDIIKEARFLQKLSHKNIIDFIGMDLDWKTLVLRYMCFDLSPFGMQKQVNSLDGLIKELGPATTLPLEFTNMISIICDSVIERLRYLHRNNVAHRDLKPGNILVSNQNIFKLQDSGIQQKLWNKNPYEVKLADFGESWSKICQDTKACKSYTTRVFTGTVSSGVFFVLLPENLIWCSKSTPT